MGQTAIRQTMLTGYPYPEPSAVEECNTCGCEIRKGDDLRVFDGEPYCSKGCVSDRVDMYYTSHSIAGE